MNHRQATNADLQEVIELLNSSELPSNDCADHIRNFIVIEEDNQIIGVGGFEIYGVVALVRSIAVKPMYRGKGIAGYIYQSLEKIANRLGVRTFYLLTESATEYFKSLGFIVYDRTKTPTTIMQTKQFKELCPSSAIVMRRDL